MTKTKNRYFEGCLVLWLLCISFPPKASAATGEGIFLSFVLDTRGAQWGEDTFLSFLLDTRRPEMSVLVDSLDFGEQIISVSSVGQGLIEIRNDGLLDLTITDLSFTGPDASEFTFDPGTTQNLPFNLAPSETLTLKISLNPSTIGEKHALIFIETNDAEQTSHTISITGTGIDTGVDENDKLLLVAGGGPFVGNPIKDQTKSLAERFYLVCNTMRGYSKDNIQYLSAFETPAENSDVDAVASSQSIEEAIRIWASDATRLTIVLLDHGSHPTQNEWYFLVNGTVDPPDNLAASQLKTILDDVQSGASPIRNIILIIDMCYSGGFLKQCSGSPEGALRQVFSSTTDERLANFGQSQGLLSFTYYFLSEAAWGNSLFTSFQSARETMVALNVPASAPQLPWFDDDGDGEYSKSDGILASQTFLGRGVTYGTLNPLIVDAKEDITLTEPQDVAIWCRLNPEVAPTYVQAVLSYEKMRYATGEPISEHTSVTLQHSGTPNLWEGNIPVYNLRRYGSYSVYYVAVKTNGLPGLDLVSPEIQRTISLRQGTSSIEGRWILYR